MSFDRRHLLLYAVTDRACTGNRRLLVQIEEAILGGATMIQLREKELPWQEFLAEALAAKTLCRRYGVPLIINDDVEIALRSGADGVHVGRDDMPVARVRALVGPELIVGATAKTVEQALQAQADGADYLGVGAVFPSPTKKNALRVTREQLREICTAVSLPVAAIGGIGQENIRELAGCGMAGFAVVSAVFAARNVREAAKMLREQAERTLGDAGREETDRTY